MTSTESKPIATPDEISLKLAISAHQGTSFSPESRGEYEQRRYAEQMEADWEYLSNLANNDEQKAILPAEFARYKEGYKSRTEAYLHAASRVMSPMITGPAKFPVQANEKKWRSKDNRLAELIDFRSRALKAIKRKFKQARTAEEVDTLEYNRLLKTVFREAAMVQAIDTGQERRYHRHAFVNSAAGKLIRSLNNGNVKLVGMVLDHVKTLEMKKPLFSARHKIWRLYEEAKNKGPEEVKTGTEIIETLGDVEIINNYDVERVQIYFPDKPSEAARAMLKRNAWKWSPRHGAWQRKNTMQAVTDAMHIIAEIQKLTV